jgi:hypothetical protein
MLDCALSEDYSKELDKVDLVDMEVAQFYFLCYALSSKPLQWAALKGPANSLDDFTEQSDNSQNILLNAIKKALTLMEIKSP